MMQHLKESSQRASLLSTLSGALIFTIAGSLWAALGLYSLKHRGQPWALIFLSLLALSLLGFAISLRSRAQKLPPDPPSPEMEKHQAWAGKRFTVVNVVQGVAIFLAVQVCNNLHAPEYFWPVGSVIVGLHFIALAPVYRSQFHRIVGALMCLLALITVFAFPKYSASALGAAAPLFIWGALLGFGNAFLLWISATTRLLAVSKSLRANPN